MFDVEFFEKKMNIGGWSHKNVAIFRLFNREGDEKYLHLYNAHNGCYSHGFEFCDRELELEEGYI